MTLYKITFVKASKSATIQFLKSDCATFWDVMSFEDATDQELVEYVYSKLNDIANTDMILGLFCIKDEHSANQNDINPTYAEMDVNAIMWLMMQFPQISQWSLGLITDFNFIFSTLVSKISFVYSLEIVGVWVDSSPALLNLIANEKSELFLLRIDLLYVDYFLTKLSDFIACTRTSSICKFVNMKMVSENITFINKVLEIKAASDTIGSVCSYRMILKHIRHAKADLTLGPNSCDIWFHSYKGRNIRTEIGMNVWINNIFIATMSFPGTLMCDILRAINPINVVIGGGTDHFSKEIKQRIIEPVLKQKSIRYLNVDGFGIFSHVLNKYELGTSVTPSHIKELQIVFVCLIHVTEYLMWFLKCGLFQRITICTITLGIENYHLLADQYDTKRRSILDIPNTFFDNVRIFERRGSNEINLREDENGQFLLDLSQRRMLINQMVALLSSRTRYGCKSQIQRLPKELIMEIMRMML